MEENQTIEAIACDEGNWILQIKYHQCTLHDFCN